MNEYIIYTSEGATSEPNPNFNIENCQVLGILQAENEYAAVHRLFHDNLWIKQAGFSESKIFIRQIITHTQRHDIQEMINYILEEIFPSVKKLGNWESMEDYNNILHVLKRLKDLSTIQK